MYILTGDGPPNVAVRNMCAQTSLEVTMIR